MLEFYQDFYLLENEGIPYQMSGTLANQEEETVSIPETAVPEYQMSGTLANQEEETISIPETAVPEYQMSGTLANQEEETVSIPETAVPESQPVQTSSTGTYIIGGIGCGVALITAALCAILFKKLSDVNHDLQQKKTEADSASQKIQQLENQLSETRNAQKLALETIQSLQDNYEKIIADIADIQINSSQSSDSNKELSSLIEKSRKYQEFLEYHDSVLRKLQSAQESSQQTAETLTHQYANLSAAVNALQISVQQQKQQKPAPVPEFSMPAPSPIPSGDISISFDEMLDLLDQKYNQAVFLSITSGMGMQPDFYEDTERKAHVILIEDRCYPNPYRFVNLEKQQETYSHLAVLAPVFDLRNIADGNGKYGLDSVLSAVVELQEDGSYTLRKKGVLSFY